MNGGNPWGNPAAGKPPLDVDVGRAVVVGGMGNRNMEDGGIINGGAGKVDWGAELTGVLGGVAVVLDVVPDVGAAVDGADSDVAAADSEGFAEDSLFFSFSP